MLATGDLECVVEAGFRFRRIVRGLGEQQLPLEPLQLRLVVTLPSLLDEGLGLGQCGEPFLRLLNFVVGLDERCQQMRQLKPRACGPVALETLTYLPDALFQLALPSLTPSHA